MFKIEKVPKSICPIIRKYKYKALQYLFIKSFSLSYDTINIACHLLFTKSINFVVEPLPLFSFIIVYYIIEASIILSAIKKIREVFLN